MSSDIAKKSLTDTLASLGISSCNVETSEIDAKTKIGDTTIIVSYPRAIEGISYYFKSADLEISTALYAKCKEVDWAAIVSSVLFNKYDSCAWIARKVCDQLRDRSYDTVVDIRASKACRLVGHYNPDGKKERYLAFMIYQIPDSRNGSYHYCLETLNGKLVAQVKEATTDEVIKRLTDVIIAEHSPKEPKSSADDAWANDCMDAIAETAKLYSNHLFTVTIEPASSEHTGVRVSTREGSCFYLLQVSDDRISSMDVKTGESGPAILKKDWLDTPKEKRLTAIWSFIVLMYNYSILEHTLAIDSASDMNLAWCDVREVSQYLTSEPFLPNTLVSGTTTVRENGTIEVDSEIFFYRQPEKGLIKISYVILAGSGSEPYGNTTINISIGNQSTIVDVPSYSPILLAIGAAMLQMLASV